MQQKKTIQVSQLLLKSILVGIVGSFILVFSLHFYGSWSAGFPNESTSDAYYSYARVDAKVPYYTLYCVFKESHHFDGDGATLEDITHGHFSLPKLIAIIKATFDDHWGAIFIIALSIASFTYILSTVRFQIVKN